ncbi:unnamed protein product [Jaminaea pallidilutea]
MVRFKNRWLLLSVDLDPFLGQGQTPPAITGHHVLAAIRQSLSLHFGSVAAGALGGPLSIKYHSARTRLAMLRCSRVGAEVVRASATLVRDFDVGGGSTTPRRNVDVRLHVIGVSGTIKKLQTQAMRLDRRLIQQEKKVEARRKHRGKVREKKGAKQLQPKTAKAQPSGALGAVAQDDEEDIGLAV